MMNETSSQDGRDGNMTQIKAGYISKRQVTQDGFHMSTGQITNLSGDMKLNMTVMSILSSKFKACLNHVTLHTKCSLSAIYYSLPVPLFAVFTPQLADRLC